MLVIGRGAVGTIMGDLLYRKLGDNFAFLVNKERKERYEKSIYLVNGQDRKYPYVCPEDSDAFGKADLILIATKYGSLPEAIEQAKSFTGPDTIFMPAINGIVSEEDLRKAFPQNITLRTIAQKMDANYHDGKEDFTQYGELVYGMDQPGQEEAIEAVNTLFDQCHLPHIVSENILYDQWNKLMLNCGINQVCAAYDATYGQAVHDPKLKKLFIQAMKEVQAVAAAKGIDIPDGELDAWVDAIDRLDPKSMPSMRQDVLAKRPTEEILFSKTIVPMAKELNIQTPVLEMLMEKIDEIDRQNIA